MTANAKQKKRTLEDEGTPKSLGFVVNSIIRVSKRAKFQENYPDLDSSDESDDCAFSKSAFNFDSDNISELPFRPFKEKVSTKEKSYGKIIRKPTAGYLYPRPRKKFDKEPEDIEIGEHTTKSTIIEPFLNKLAAEGFEIEDRDLTKDKIKASICLNKMFSLSSRENKALYHELNSKVESDIRFEKFGVFWNCKWLDKEGEEISQETVRKFYKQLKRKDSEKAKKFLDLTEGQSVIKVPYQELREYAKNHDKTKRLVAEFREEKPDGDFFLSIVDGDTVDFNGIFSAYLRILKDKTPTVMSTGYEFPIDPEYGDVFKLASMIDRSIRVITNLLIPGGVYFPEPNMCILIPPGFSTVPESFINKTAGNNGDSESAAILRNIFQNRSNPEPVFVKDNPLLTSIPARVRCTKSSKTSTKITNEGKKGISLSENDIRAFKQVSQSHFHEHVWDTNILINDAIKINGSTKPHCKKLIAKIRNSETDAERENALAELKKYIDPNIADGILAARELIKEYISKFEIKYLDNEDKQGLLDILENIEDIEVDNFPIEFRRDVILMLSQVNVIKMIEDELINPILIRDGISQRYLTMKILEEIFYGERILDFIKHCDLSFKTLMKFCQKVNYLEKDFTEEINDILDLYSEYSMQSEELDYLFKIYILVEENDFNTVIESIYKFCNQEFCEWPITELKYELATQLYQKCIEREDKFSDVLSNVNRIAFEQEGPCTGEVEEIIKLYIQNSVHLRILDNTYGPEDINYIIAEYYNDKEAIEVIIKDEDYEDDVDLEEVINKLEGNKKSTLISNLKEIALEKLYSEIDERELLHAKISIDKQFILEVYELDPEDLASLESIPISSLINWYRTIQMFEKEFNILEVITKIYTADISINILYKLYKLSAKHNSNSTEAITELLGDDKGCVQDYIGEENFLELYEISLERGDDISELIIDKISQISVDIISDKTLQAYRENRLDDLLREEINTEESDEEGTDADSEMEDSDYLPSNKESESDIMEVVSMGDSDSLT